MSVYTSSIEFRGSCQGEWDGEGRKGLAMKVVVYIANFVVVVVVVVVVIVVLCVHSKFQFGFVPLQTMVVMVILLTCSHATTLVWKLVAMATWRRFASSGMIS